MKQIFAVAIVCSFSFPAFSQIPWAENTRIEHDYFEASINAPVQLPVWSVIEDTVAWKNWEVVENYTFGKNRGVIPMITDLQALHPFFRDKILLLMAQCEQKGISLAIVETYRTRTKQSEYKSMGRRYTRSTAGRSKHQYGLAVDIVPVVNGEPVWNSYALWRKVGLMGEKLGLRWGGRWRHPYDPGHFEWTGGIGTNQLVAGSFPAVPRNIASEYPCLEEDLRELQRAWAGLETEQSALAATLIPRKGQKQGRQASGGQE